MSPAERHALSAGRKAPSSWRERRGNRRVQRIHHRRGQLEMAYQRRGKAGFKRFSAGSVVLAPTAGSE